MVDLGLNSNFSVHLDDRNDLGYVEGRAAFEQEVVVSLTDYLYADSLGDMNFENIKHAVRLQVSRVARKHDELDTIARITIERSEDDANTLAVSVVYDTGGPLTFEVDT